MPTLLAPGYNDRLGTGSTTVAVNSLTGNNVKVWAVVLSRGVLSSQTHSATYDGVSMGSPDLIQDINVNGFAVARILIWQVDVGNPVAKTANVVVQTFNGSGVGTSVSAFGFDSMKQGQDETGTDVSGSQSAVSASLLTMPSGHDWGIAGFLPGTWSATINNIGDQVVIHSVARNIGGGADYQHWTSYVDGYTSGGDKDIHYSFSALSHCSAAAFYEVEEAILTPTITSVNGGADVNIIDTAIPVVGTNFVPGASNTEFWLADGTDFGTAVKVQQSISSITSTTFDWDSVSMGGFSPGNFWVFVRTNPGTGSEAVSAAHPVTIVAPDPPVITDVDGGSTVDVTTTNATVNGTDLYTTGVSGLYLADGTDFGTSTLVAQSISSVTTTSYNWDAVTMGSLVPGPLYLFAVSDDGGGAEQVSAAFPITVTEPSTPIITAVEGESTEPVHVFENWTNLAVDGTDFDPGGTTELWLGQSSDWNTTFKVQQSFTGLTNVFLDWTAIDHTGITAGLMYLYVVTQVGTPQERVSPPFGLLVFEVLPPVITAANGGNTLITTDTSIAMSGQRFVRPGTPEFWLADGTDFGLATKVQQAISALDFFSFTWPSIDFGGLLSPGTLYLFFVTDAGGSNEQISAAFMVTITSVSGPRRMEMIGDGMGMVVCPVVDETPVVPEVSALVLRDHACWTGTGVWYLGRDFVQWPSANGDIVLRRRGEGVWPSTESIVVESVAVSNADRMLADEELNVFTASLREVFIVGFWINVENLLVLTDVNNVSIFQIESDTGEYLEVYLEEQSGNLHLGIAFHDTQRRAHLHAQRLADAPRNGAWVFVEAEWRDIVALPGNELTLRQGGNEQVWADVAGTPWAGLYTQSFIVHDFVLNGGLNTPNIYLQLQGLFYGFGPLSLTDTEQLRNSLTRTQYELTLQTLMTQPGIADGPLHYYRMDDFIPDRFIHNHAVDFAPGRVIGGGIQRGLSVPPYGVVKRLFNGAQIRCDSSAGNWNDWGATFVGHMRFIGTPSETGVFARLVSSATGASIELSKISAGPAPQAQNGRVQFTARDATGTPVWTHIIENPTFDAFDGSFHAFVLTTGPLANQWYYSIGSIGSWYTEHLGVDIMPSWHGQPYDRFEFGNLSMDVHSWGYIDDVNLDPHTSFFSWSTFVDIILYAQTQNFTGFYWCQNEVGND